MKSFTLKFFTTLVVSTGVSAAALAYGGGDERPFQCDNSGTIVLESCAVVKPSWVLAAAATDKVCSIYDSSSNSWECRSEPIYYDLHEIVMVPSTGEKYKRVTGHHIQARGFGSTRILAFKELKEKLEGLPTSVIAVKSCKTLKR